MTTEYKRPLPLPTTDTKPYWEACARHEFIIPRCRSCGKHFFYPRSLCPNCMSTDLEWVKASGRGKVYSFSVVQHPFRPEWKDAVPYVAALVDLEEGPRMSTNIVGCKPEEVKIDMPVEVVFEDLVPGVAVPKFKPSSR